MCVGVSRKEIVFFTRKISGVMGGLERQIIEIAKVFQRNNFNVTIVTLDGEDIELLYDDHNTIKVVPIGIGNPDSKSNWITRLNRQVKMIKVLKSLKPDAGIAFMFGGFVMSRIAMFICRKPLILAERNSPIMYSLTRISRIRHLLFLSYIFSRRITVQFDSYVKKYPWYLRRKIVSIPNTIYDIGLLKNKPSSKIRYVFAGRFSFQKQIIRLVEAFSEFHPMYPQATLTLYGEGELEDEILEKISKLRMQGYVKLMKPSKIEEILKKTDIMCVLSKWEGFPNTLAESLKSGVPAIGFRNCDGVSDLIIDSVNGWTELDTNREIEILKLLERSYLESIGEKMSPIKIRRTMDLYDPKRIEEKWISLLNSVIEN